MLLLYSFSYVAISVSLWRVASTASRVVVLRTLVELQWCMCVCVCICIQIIKYEAVGGLKQDEWCTQKWLINGSVMITAID